MVTYKSTSGGVEVFAPVMRPRARRCPPPMVIVSPYSAEDDAYAASVERDVMAQRGPAYDPCRDEVTS